MNELKTLVGEELYTQLKEKGLDVKLIVAVSDFVQKNGSTK